MGKSCCGGAFSGVAKPEVQKHARTVLEGMFRHKKVMYSIVLSFLGTEYRDDFALRPLQKRFQEHKYSIALACLEPYLLL